MLNYESLSKMRGKAQFLIHLIKALNEDKLNMLIKILQNAKVTELISLVLPGNTNWLISHCTYHILRIWKA